MEQKIAQDEHGNLYRYDLVPVNEDEIKAARDEKKKAFDEASQKVDNLDEALKNNRETGEQIAKDLKEAVAAKEAADTDYQKSDALVLALESPESVVLGESEPAEAEGTDSDDAEGTTIPVRNRAEDFADPDESDESDAHEESEPVAEPPAAVV